MAPKWCREGLFSWIGHHWMSLTVFLLATFIIGFILNTSWLATLSIAAMIILFLYVSHLWDIVILKLYFLAEGLFCWLGRRIRWLKRDWRPAALILVLASILVALFSGLYQLETLGEIKVNSTLAYNSTVKLEEWWTSDQLDSPLIYSDKVFKKIVFHGGEMHNSSIFFQKKANNTTQNIINLSLKNISLWNETFSDAIVRIALLGNVTLSNISANNTEVLDFSIESATLETGIVEDVSIFNATLRDATLVNENLKDSKTTNFTIVNASMKEAIIRNASLHNSAFKNVLMPKDVPIQNNSNNSGSYNITKINLMSPGNAEMDAIAYNATIDTIKLKHVIISNATIREVHLENITSLNPESISSNSTIENAVLSNAKIQDFDLVNEPSRIKESFSIWTLLQYAAKAFDYYLSIVFSQWITILLVWMLIFLLIRAWNVHKRIVIREITDKSGQGQDGNAIANLLAIRLSELNDIYSKANEARSIPTSTGIDQPLQTSIAIPEIEVVSQIDNLMKTTKSASTLSWIQPVSDAVSQIVSLAVQTIFSPPNIVGELYKSKDVDSNDILILTARIFGGELEYNSWKVSKKIVSKSEEEKTADSRRDNEEKPAAPVEERSPQPSNEGKALILETEINELACRIFTDLVFNPHRRELVRWLATLRFSEGLRAYRSSLRSRLDKKINLIDAEKRFLETLEVDEQFNMVYYNLGVVYNELGRGEAACRAFQKSIEKSPDDWEPYYALARNYFESMTKERIEGSEKENNGKIDEVLRFRCNEIIELCNHAICLGEKPKEQEAKIYDLMGLTQRNSEMVNHSLHDFNELKQERIELGEAIISHMRAVKLSYEALYECELKGGDASEIRIVMSNCLLSLATDYYYNDFAESTFYSSEMLLREAIHLSPSLEILYIRLGEIYLMHGLPEEAIEMMARARAINPNSLDVLSRIAAISKKARTPAESKYIEELFMESSSRASEQELARICKVNLNSPIESYAIRSIKRIENYSGLVGDLKKNKISLRDLDKQLENIEFDDPVLYGKVAILLKQYYHKQDLIKGKESADHCRRAIKILEALQAEWMKTAILDGLRLIKIEPRINEKDLDWLEKVSASIDEIAMEQNQKKSDTNLDEKFKELTTNLNKNVYSTEGLLEVKRAGENVKHAGKILSLAKAGGKDKKLEYMNEVKQSIERTKMFLDNVDKNKISDNKFYKAKDNIERILLNPVSGYENAAIVRNLEEARSILERVGKAPVKDAISEIKYIEWCLDIMDPSYNDQSRYVGQIKQIRSLLEESLKILKEVRIDVFEFSDICSILGDLYLHLGSSDNAAKAEHHYRAAIDALKAHPIRAAQMKLKNKLSQAISYQSRFIESQREAEDSINLDPFSDIDREELAFSFFFLKDYKKARAAWENAMHLNPDKPRYRLFTGITYIMEAQEAPIDTDFDERLEKAQKFLLQALDLLESEESVLRMMTHYWLGVLYKKKKQHDNAIYHFGVSKLLADNEELRPEKLMIGYSLAKLYISNKMHDAGETELKEVMQKGKKISKSIDINQSCGEALLLRPSIGYVLAQVHLNLSSLYTRQSVVYIENPSFSLPLSSHYIGVGGQNRLDKALDHAQSANKYINELRSKINRPGKGEDSAKFLDEEVAECEGDLWNCYGKIAYKRGAVGKSDAKSYAESQIDEAILLFEASVSRYPKIRNYVHLALACKKKVEFLDERISRIEPSLGNKENPAGSPINDTSDSSSSPPKKDTKAPSKERTIEPKMELSIAQREQKDRLSIERQQKDYCIKECYNYINIIKNKGQYSDDDPDEYSDELLELKNYIDNSASAPKTVKSVPEAKKPRPDSEDE